MDVGLLSKALGLSGPGQGKLAAAAAAAFATAHMMPSPQAGAMEPVPISVLLQLMQNISTQCCKHDEPDDIVRAMKDYATQVMNGQVPLNPRMVMGHPASGSAHAACTSNAPAAAAAQPSSSEPSGAHTAAGAPSKRLASGKVKIVHAEGADGAQPSRRPATAAAAPSAQSAGDADGTPREGAPPAQAAAALDALRLAGYAPDAVALAGDLQAMVQQAELQLMAGLDAAAPATLPNGLPLVETRGARGPAAAAPAHSVASPPPAFLKATVSPFLQHPYAVLDKLQAGAQWRQAVPAPGTPPARPPGDDSSAVQPSSPARAPTPRNDGDDEPADPAAAALEAPLCDGSGAHEATKPPQPPTAPGGAAAAVAAARGVSPGWQGVLDILMNAGPQPVQGSALVSGSVGGGSTAPSTEDIFSVKSEDASGGEGSAAGSHASAAPVSKSSKRSKKKKSTA